MVQDWLNRIAKAMDLVYGRDQQICGLAVDIQDVHSKSIISSELNAGWVSCLCEGSQSGYWHRHQTWLKGNFGGQQR